MVYQRVPAGQDCACVHALAVCVTRSWLVVALLVVAHAQLATTYMGRLLAVAKEKSNVLRTFRLKDGEVRQLSSDVLCIAQCFEKVVSPELVNKTLSSLFTVRDFFTETEKSVQLVNIFKDAIRVTKAELGRDGRPIQYNKPHAYHVRGSAATCAPPITPRLDTDAPSRVPHALLLHV